MKLRRDGLHWMTVGQEDSTLVMKHHRFPRWPKQYGQALTVPSEVLNVEATFKAVSMLLWNAQGTDQELRQSGKRGLDFRTMQLYYVAPTETDDATFGWKAASR